jgi:hypothetical protein
MKQTKPRAKLLLTRESIRALSPDRLEAARGGSYYQLSVLGGSSLGSRIGTLPSGATLSSGVTVTSLCY